MKQKINNLSELKTDSIITSYDDAVYKILYMASDKKSAILFQYSFNHNCATTVTITNSFFIGVDYYTDDEHKYIFDELVYDIKTDTYKWEE